MAASAFSLAHHAKDDPLQPLRTMADRVGKEVEKFAERVDHWHTHGNEDPKAKYHTTLKMVGKFKDLAESTVKELTRQHEAEHQGELAKSMRRRIKTMADQPAPGQEAEMDDSFQSVVPSIESHSAPSSSKVHELRQWQAELATWELLRIIIEHYHHEPGLDLAAMKRKQLAEVGGGWRYSPNIETWNRFLLEDDQAKEKDIILRWLEQTAQTTETDIQSMTAQLEAQSGKDTDSWNMGWLDTRAKIKQQKRMLGSDRPLQPDVVDQRSLPGSKSEPLITQLDPDAPIRQKRQLEDSDDYYERALWMACYEMLRRGTPWAEICEWCKEKNEAWRGISMGTAYENHPNGGPNVAGRDFGYLYRRVCYFAAIGSHSLYESAIYGLLSGNQEAVEPVCRTWDDHLYAHYNALLLSRFDRYLEEHHQQRLPQDRNRHFVFKDAVKAIGEWQESPRIVVDLLMHRKSTKAQSISPMKLIQGALISRRVKDLVYQVGLAISTMLRDDPRAGNLIVDPQSDIDNPQSKASDEQPTVPAEKYYHALATDPNALRILVHVLIVMRRGLGEFEVADVDEFFALDNVIALYIELLRVSKRTDLIPLYAAQLEGSRQIHCLARVLADIKNPQDQKRCIALMQQYRINPVDVISRNCYDTLERSGLKDLDKYVSNYEIMERVDEAEYLWPGQRPRRTLPGVEITAKEHALIEALKWNTHLGKEKVHTYAGLISALRYFLLNGRYGAANLLITEMSAESISLIKTDALCGYPFDFNVPGSEIVDKEEIKNALRRIAKATNNHPRPHFPFPIPSEHTRIVKSLRRTSQTYYELQQLVGIIELMRQWREEEDNLIKAKKEGNTKPSTKRAKDLFENISAILLSIFDKFLTHSSDGRLLSIPNTRSRPTSLLNIHDADPIVELADIPLERAEHSHIFLAYVPEIILTYLSIAQAGSFFLSRDLSTKAMEMANLVADDRNKWVQDAFLGTKRMTQLVEMLARVSKAMLSLSEIEEGARRSAMAGGKKRGSRGETVRIWDVNVRN
ncbi:nuclear pore complex protein-like protein Nup107 [Clohesyomyces aquaticus]|uniref:Nuclear pore complex protein n=1 Tax=Clohesyomyces aquaticus TaxID=1231657 RepID=A0A1Y2A726_9PLEO|nr:nuclear pore complex protein-like protein Nup107 [Clohesyomyces aquaticus]